ncbi:Bloom syndrome protein, partial [Orchesella cincta]
EEIIQSRDKMMTYAYIKLGPKAEKVLSGFTKVQFPVSKPKEKAPTNAAEKSLNLELEGTIGALQKACYRDLIIMCKEIAAGMGVTQWTTIMSAQALRAMSVAMPETPNEMLQLPGVTKANFDKYGAKLLEITVKSSADRFTLLAEEQDKIEDFDSQPRPSTSKGFNSANTSVAKKRAAKAPHDDGWINMDSQESQYFNNARAKGKAAPKKKAFTFGATKKYKRTSTSTKTARKSKFSPKKTTAGRKVTSTATTKYGASNSRDIGFMPMPIPR